MDVSYCKNMAELGAEEEGQAKVVRQERKHEKASKRFASRGFRLRLHRCLLSLLCLPLSVCLLACRLSNLNLAAIFTTVASRLQLQLLNASACGRRQHVRQRQSDSWQFA